MFAVASLLDTQSDQKTRELWEYLLGQCGLLGILTTPIPHLTWQVAESYSDGAILQLERISSVISPISVRVGGVGVFTGDNPVVHLSLVKTARLMQIHQIIWDMLSSYGHDMNKYYAPDRWMPHITLAYRDVTRENLMCALESLAFRSLDTEVSINNLSMIYSEKENGIAAQYFLRSSKKVTPR